MPTQTRPLTGKINAISLSGHPKVYIYHGPPSLVVEAEKQEDFDKITTEVQGGTLVIKSKGNSISVQGNFSGYISIGGGRVVINGEDVSNLSGVSVMGEVIVRVTTPTPVADISIQGSGDVDYLVIDQEEIEGTVSGSGTLRLEGKVERFRGDVAGSGDIKAGKLVALTARLSVAGSGDIRSHVVNTVKARVTGSGDIRISGNPAQRDTQVTGSGDIDFE